MPLTKSLIAAAPVYSVIPAKDIQRARDYYDRVLGLETMDAPDPSMFMFTAGKGTQALVYQTTATDGATVASFLVDDVEAAVRDLRDRGVIFQEYDMPGLKTVNGIADMGTMGKSAWFMDSEGNALSIAQM
jgi:predicted enzyme related to lactoylglutathione lyase